MFAVLGPMLLVLAAIGIYAVVGYAVSHRSRSLNAFSIRDPHSNTHIRAVNPELEPTALPVIAEVK